MIWGVVIFLAGAICLRMAFKDMEKEAAARRGRRKTAQRNMARNSNVRGNSVQRVKRVAAPARRPDRVQRIHVVGNEYGARRASAGRQPKTRRSGCCATGSTVQVRCCQR